MKKFTVRHDGSLSFPEKRRASPALSPLPDRNPSPNSNIAVSKEALLRSENMLLSFSEAGASLPSRLRLPAQALTGRESVMYLEASLQQRLDGLSVEKDLSKHDYVTKAQDIFNDIAVELTRQVAAHCSDRGRLLARLWVRYSDLINMFSQMFVDERERHREEEEKMAASLRKARLDYVKVVQHTERLINEQFEKHSAVLEAQEKRERDLCAEINDLKEQLYRSEVMLRSYSAPRTQLEQLVGDEPKAQGSADSELRQEIRELRMKLVDASSELLQYRSQKELVYSRGTMTDRLVVEERASSPIIVAPTRRGSVVSLGGDSEVPNIELTEPPRGAKTPNSRGSTRPASDRSRR